MCSECARPHDGCFSTLPSRRLPLTQPDAHSEALAINDKSPKIWNGSRWTECPLKVVYVEWGSQALDWPSISTCRFCHAQGLNNPSPACNTSETSTNGSRNGPEIDPSVQNSIYPGGWGLSCGHLCTHQVAPSECQAGPCPGIRSVTTKYLNQIPSCSKSMLISYSHYDSVHIWGPGGVS